MHSSCAAASVRAPCAFLESVALLDTSNTAVPAPPRPSRSCIRTRLAPVDASLPSGVEKATTGALVIHKADDRLALRCVRLLRQLFTRSNAGIARDISAVVSVYACAAGNHFIAITLSSYFAAMTIIQMPHVGALLHHRVDSRVLQETLYLLTSLAYVAVMMGCFSGPACGG